MKNREKFMLIFGTLAGAAAGYWLNGRRGRKVRSQVADASLEQVSKARKYVIEEGGAMKNHAGRLIEKSVELAREALQHVQSETNETSASVTDSISKGIARAKKAIDELESQLEEVSNKT